MTAGKDGAGDRRLARHRAGRGAGADRRGRGWPWSHAPPSRWRAAAEAGGHAIPADVSTTEGVHTLATYVGELLGDAPDLIVSAAGSFCAGAAGRGRRPRTSTGRSPPTCAGPFLLVRAFLPAMLARGAGHFVHVGSIAGRAAFPENGAYSASKFGLRGLHEVLPQEIRGTGVRATLVEPAATDTPLWDPIDPDARADLPSARVHAAAGRRGARGAVRGEQPPSVQISSIAVEATG